MEGDGVVAVVQGLQDAGLAVTLLSSRFAKPRRSVVADVLGALPANQARTTAVDTGTETAFGHSFPTGIGADYRSSYQLAHCSLSGSTPVRSPQYSSQEFQHFRSSISRSHDEEVFVESLRKYPVISPIKSRSADLIERMLSYTQNKNGARSNSKSAKSLPPKEASIHAQLDEIPTRDCGISRTDNLKPHFGYKRNVELMPAVSNSNRKTRQENETAMYDYLKSSRKDKKLKGHEVRYLTNVKQCLRERLRQMCDENPTTICPKIQSRYNYHRRQHHGSHHSNKCAACNEAQASTSLGAQSSLSSSRQPSKVSKSAFKQHKACFCNQPVPCSCAPESSQLIPQSEISPEDLSTPACTCTCHASEDPYKNSLEEKVKDWAQEIPVYASFSASDRIKRDEMINHLIDSLMNVQQDSQFLEKAEQEIKNCLNDLPMWHPVNKEDREVLEKELINSLLQRLKSITNLNDKSTFEDAVNTWVNNLSVVNTADKEKLANDLKTRLKSVALRRPSNAAQYKEALKSEIINVFKDFPNEMSSIEPATLNDLADKLITNLVDIPFEQISSSHKPTLQNIVVDWVKEFPKFSNDNQLDEEDYNLINDLVIKLKNIYNKGNANNNREEISNEITNWINSFEEKKKCAFELQTKKLLTNQLIDKIFDLRLESEDLETKNINDVVKKWFQDNILGEDIFDDDGDLDVLTARLQNLQSDDRGENSQNIMRKEILDWLQNMQRKHGKYIDSGTQENLTNKLLSMIRDERGLTYGKNNLDTESSLITQKIWEWLESLKDFPMDNTSKYRNMVTELSNKLKDKIREKGELTESDIKADINNWIDKLTQKQGLVIDKENRRLLENQLLKCIQHSKKRKSWERPENFSDTIIKEVTNFINDPLLRLKESDKAQVKEQITKILKRDWNPRHSSQIEKPLAEIIDILKQKTTLSHTKIDKIAHNLMNRIKETIFTNLVDEAKDKSLRLNKNLKTKLRSEIVDILKSLPGKYKEAVVDKITNILSDTYTDESDKVFKKIYETLKTSDVNEAEAVSITNKVLDMMKKFKNDNAESDFDTTFKSSSYGSVGSLQTQKQMFMQRIEQEITDFMEKILNETSSSFRDKTSTDYFDSTRYRNVINDSPLKTSTPKTGSDDYAFSDQEKTMFSTIQAETEIGSDNAYKDKLRRIVRQWISSLELSSDMDETYKDDMANDIATDIIDREMYKQLSKTKTSSQEELEHLKYQIFKWTSKLPSFNELSTKASKIKQLMESLERAKRSKLVRDINNTEGTSKNEDVSSLTDETFNLRQKNAIQEAVMKWCQKLPLKPGATYENISGAVNKLAEAISRYWPHTEEENLDVLKKEIINNLKKLPVRIDNNDSKTLTNLTDNLFETLKSVLNDTEKYYKSVEGMGLPKPPVKKAAEMMYENIQDWCENLPLKLGNTNEDMEKVKILKQNVAAKLLKKIGELNLDPEIFHDDFLYEDVLSEEIEQIINTLPRSSELHDILPTLKDNLIKSILKAKESMKNEMAGYAYKQQLRDAISKTLSSIGLPVTDETPFEVLKDHLADAFISLHYVADDEELKKKFKEKIFNEVTKFCNDYLKRYPSTPLNANVLNQELYQALKRVPMPKEESLRQEVEQIRMKDFVADWFKDLPFEDIPSQEQENKIISVLAKRLHEIEKEAEFNSKLDVDDVMKNEISKWVKKFKIKLKDSNLEAAAKKLIDQLKATKDSRKLQETTIRKSLSYSDLARNLEEIPSPKSKRPPIVDNVNNFRTTYPPSGLSAEDKAHLQRIRERTAPDRASLKPDTHKDASVNPLPIASGIQTDDKQGYDNVYQRISQNASIQTIIRDAEQPLPITPQVIVKEYYWDSSRSPPIDQSGSIMSCTLSPATPGYTRQQAKITSQDKTQVTTASQTLPTLSTAKATDTQEAPVEMAKSSDHVRSAPHISCLKKLLQNQEHLPTPQPEDDTVMKEKAGKRVCQSCVRRPELSDTPNKTEVRTSEALQNIEQETEERTNIQKCRPECPSERYRVDSYWGNDNICHQPCFRRRIYETPTNDLEYSSKNKRKVQRPCCSRSHTTKCTIRPIQMPCQSHKSCNAMLKHCPKCWDGFCPHPSYLYFR